MIDMRPQTALIIGAGHGLSASLARLLSLEGVRVALAARDISKLDALCEETSAKAFRCDAADKGSVQRLFEEVEDTVGSPQAVVYNPSRRVRGPITEIDPDEAEAALKVTALGGLMVGQLAAKAMLRNGFGTILFTGASAGLKGFPHSAIFAMGKFALRGLAQSMARELQPQGIHVAYVNIDGAIRPADAPKDSNHDRLDPDAIAETYWHLIVQPRSAWTTEVELRPWVERF